EYRDAELACMREQWCMPLPWRVSPLVQLIKGLAGPQSLPDLEVRLRAVQRDGIGRIGLDLHRVRACRARRFNDFERSLDVAIVVRGHFRNHVRRQGRTDLATCDANG